MAIQNNSNLQEPLFAAFTPEAQESIKTKSSGAKRKRGSQQQQISRKSPRTTSTSKIEEARSEDGLDIELRVNTAFSRINSELLADYIAQRTRRYESNLSLVELQDKYIPATAIQDTTSWDKPRTLDNLPAFLEKFSGNSTKLWSASKKNGAPHTIIVTAAGLRAAVVAREMRRFQTNNTTVAKLFAKHIKLKDAIKFLKSTRTGIAVGTPIRLKDLMDDGALSIERLERIVIDASHIDQKKRGILEMKETQVALTIFLGQSQLKERYTTESGAVQLLFF